MVDKTVIAYIKYFAENSLITEITETIGAQLTRFEAFCKVQAGQQILSSHMQQLLKGVNSRTVTESQVAKLIDGLDANLFRSVVNHELHRHHFTECTLDDANSFCQVVEQSLLFCTLGTDGDLTFYRINWSDLFDQ